MFSSLFSALALAAVLGSAQAQTSTATRSSSRTAGTTATATGSSGSACAQVSSSLASYARANPQATRALRLPAQLAFDCASSAPIVQDDALQVIDGVAELLEWQSTLAFLKNPPASYPLAAVDLVAELTRLRSTVRDGGFANEIEFETNLTSLLARAHDGHLNFNIDGQAVFSYTRSLGPVVSVSNDGQALPQLYFLNELLLYLDGQGEEPSAITEVNGNDANQWISTSAENDTMIGGFQDPDALFNSFLFSYNSGSPGSQFPGFFQFVGSFFPYPGPSTSITFANGSTATYTNFATTRQDFTDVTDGDSFYYAFCNATAKAIALGYNPSASATEIPTATATETTATFTATRQAAAFNPRSEHIEKRQSSTDSINQLPGYPQPLVIAEDGSLSGYFIDAPGFQDLAVLVLTSMSEASQESFQSTLRDFLDQCRSTKKTHLVIDSTGNPGGSVALGYEVFKQLFPTLEPYAAGNFRAHESYDLLGQVVSNRSEEVREAQPNNETAFAGNGGYSPFAAESYNNDSGQPFTSWEDFYGPVKVNSDNFTNLLRWDIADPVFTEAAGGIVISGYGNESDVGAQPFSPENMIFLTDGQCSSTCTILAHLLKWQGKVKQISMGGRPQNAPMQAIGGVKGSEVYQWGLLYQFAYYFSQFTTKAVFNTWQQSGLGTILNDGAYMILRTRTAGESPSDIQYNSKNNIAEGDHSYTPLQFVYEASDCRLWFQPLHYYDIQLKWATVGEQAFGLNGTSPYSLCVRDSTNQSTSLSGNATLYNGGVPTNVTDFIAEVDGPNEQSSEHGSGTGSGDGSGSGSGNGSSKLGASATLAMLIAGAVAFAL